MLTEKIRNNFKFEKEKMSGYIQFDILVSEKLELMEGKGWAMDNGQQMMDDGRLCHDSSSWSQSQAELNIVHMPCCTDWSTLA